MKQPFSQASSPPLSQLKQNTETILLKWISDTKKNDFQTLRSGGKSRWRFVPGSTAVLPGPGAHTAPAACLAAGSYGRWLEIIVFNNADHHKSSWEITLNITLGLYYRNTAKGNCPYDAQGLE